jgi:hypothetical protein
MSTGAAAPLDDGDRYERTARQVPGASFVPGTDISPHSVVEASG